MDKENFDKENGYDGAINQITPAPDNFMPRGIIDLENKERIVVKRTPHRKQKLACFLYFCIQTIIISGIGLNYNLFSTGIDMCLWIITLITFLAYFRVCFSNPGYVEGNIIMTEEPNEYDLREFDTFPDTHREEKVKGHEKKRSLKTSVLTKGFIKHSRFVKSSSCHKEKTKHIRNSSVGNNLMTQSNQQVANWGYTKLNDQTFKSGDFSKIKTEMEDVDLFETNPNEQKGYHRRKTSTIKKIGTVPQYDLFDNEAKNPERDKVFNMMAERIANSRATFETEQVPHSSPLSGGDTNSTFHHKGKGNEENQFQLNSEDFKGVLKSFKDGEESTENKQLPLASNAITNDTDFVTANNTGLKKRIELQDFEEIKEEDENYENYDVKKYHENVEKNPDYPNIEHNKRCVSDIGRKSITLKMQQDDLEFSAHDEVFKNQDTKEDDAECEDIDANMIFIEQKFCTACNIEQPLRTKHCRTCKKCVATYDHHCPWVGNCIAEK